MIRINRKVPSSKPGLHAGMIRDNQLKRSNT